VSRAARAQLREAPLGRLLSELGRRAAGAPFAAFGAALEQYEARTPRALQVLGALGAAVTLLGFGVHTGQGAVAAAAGPLGAAALLRAATRTTRNGRAEPALP
jgi:hypothetical protein